MLIAANKEIKHKCFNAMLTEALLADLLSTINTLADLLSTMNTQILHNIQNDCAQTKLVLIKLKHI